MKYFLKSLVIALLFIINSQAQAQQKIMVSEDTFIEGGESSDKIMGEVKHKNIRIFNSQEATKYARIGYLKFKMPKKLSEVSSVELNMPLKVYKNENRPNEKFNLEIFVVEDDKWNELSITWEDALELGVMVGEAEVEQSLDDKHQWIKIELDAKEISKLFDGKKDRNITLALMNNNFNKVSAMAPTKESYSKNASYLIIE